MALPRQIENEKANPKSVTSNHSPLGGTSYYDDREDSHIRWVQNTYSYMTIFASQSLELLFYKH